MTAKPDMSFEDAYTEASSKPRDYFEQYDEILCGVDRFASYKILEIGVDIGSGVRALSKYFPNSQIFGLDINPDCAVHAGENIQIVIGSQVDDEILTRLSQEKFDLIIDDGSHHNSHVIPTCNRLFPSLSSEKLGLYVIEDTHTSYFHRYGGGYSASGTMNESLKHLVDVMHTWCIRQEQVEATGQKLESFSWTKKCGWDTEYMEKWTKSVQFYENISVVKKRKVEARCSRPL